MKRLAWIVATICLLQSIILAFVLVPIRVQAFPATSGSPAVWLILDWDFVLQNLACFPAGEPVRCFAEVGEIFNFVSRFGIRIGICFLAAASGGLSFRWRYLPPEPFR